MKKSTQDFFDMLKIVRITWHFVHFFYEKYIFLNAAILEKLIFLKTATYFFRYFSLDRSRSFGIEFGQNPSKR